jgi:hypothetical protein
MSTSATTTDVMQIRGLTGYSLIFHEQIIPQHGQFYLFNKDFKLEDCIDFNMEIYQPLNEANLLLGRLYKKMITDLKGSGAVAQVARQLDTLLAKWQECHKTGGVYSSFKQAAEILAILNNSGIPAKETIVRNREVSRAFIEIPYEVKSQFHLGILVRDQDMNAIFEKLLEGFLKDTSLSYYILETKISAPLELENRGKGKFRNIKFLLNPKIVNNKRNPVIGEITSLLQECNGLLEQDDQRFSKLVNGVVTVFQGPRNYKMFLELLEIIQVVYSKEDNFAYLIDEIPGDQIVPGNN